MQTVGCSEGTYLRASRELTRTGQIVKKQVLLRPYTSGWITYLPGNRISIQYKQELRCPDIADIKVDYPSQLKDQH